MFSKPAAREHPGTLLELLTQIEGALGENLDWLIVRFDLELRQKNPDTMRRLAQLHLAWHTAARALGDIQSQPSLQVLRLDRPFAALVAAAPPMMVSIASRSADNDDGLYVVTCKSQWVGAWPAQSEALLKAYRASVVLRWPAELHYNSARLATVTSEPALTPAPRSQRRLG